jgi:hypothetical protein
MMLLVKGHSAAFLTRKHKSLRRIVADVLVKIEFSG